MEVGVLLGPGQKVLYWHNPEGRSEAYLPDSRSLWEVMWENRHRLSGFAHSHPGSGPVSPSWEDVTTFAAIEAALGRRLNWWIVNKYHISLVTWKGPDKCNYQVINLSENGLKSDDCLDWVRDLRIASYGRHDDA